MRLEFYVAVDRDERPVTTQRTLGELRAALDGRTDVEVVRVQVEGSPFLLGQIAAELTNRGLRFPASCIEDEVSCG